MAWNGARPTRWRRLHFSGQASLVELSKGPRVLVFVSFAVLTTFDEHRAETDNSVVCIAMMAVARILRELIPAGVCLPGNRPPRALQSRAMSGRDDWGINTPDHPSAIAGTQILCPAFLLLLSRGKLQRRVSRGPSQNHEIPLCFKTREICMTELGKVEGCDGESVEARGSRAKAAAVLEGKKWPGGKARSDIDSRGKACLRHL